LSENIADNGGLNIAYEAWVSFEKDMNGNLRRTVLPDYNGLTDEQVFFVSFAQTWCGVQDDDQLKFVVRTRKEKNVMWSTIYGFCVSQLLTTPLSLSLC
jgi:predicted metalloendopeptidase